MEESMQKLSSILLTTLIGISIVPLAHESMAQTTPAPLKTGTRLITLGTLAGPNPQAHQAQSSNLLIVNGVMYVIDAGDGVARRLAKAGINIRDIGTVFLTHLHDDHTSGLGTLMSVAWNQNRTHPINVYGPPRTNELVKAAVQYFTISAEIRISDGGRTVPLAQVFFGHDVGTGVIYQDVNIKVTAVENTHFHFHKGADAGKHKSYSYRFETPHRVIVFTGDTGSSDALTELAKDADLFVTETVSFQDRMDRLIQTGQWQVMTPEEQVGIRQQATQGHMTPDIIGKTATSAKVKTVVLTHLTYKANGDYTARIEEVKKHFSGQVLIAKDLMEF
jgi:ribonuclease BN (tRNA processing enzyme)